ncbi:Solitary outer membrane autotransporter beta-barrel domain [Pseudoalteromonas sp. SCSIO 43101]|nr:Solitary outer membrane autotransporter beta-barrel domain [Pseudoalteromonas sp. SCSIO 43101]URQ92558.1 Solitary outer membrane autotransporter beta-barrel domain [Pseudoalteromonas sp. SCSIO 43101]
MKLLFKLWILLQALSTFNLYASPTKQLETAFATSLVLTDGDSITLGFGDFDPQTLF